MSVQNKKLAAIYMMFSASSFATMQFFVKLTANQIPLFEQVLVRNLIITLMMFYTLYKYKNVDKLKVAEGARLALLVRSFCGFMGVVLFFYTLRKMNLADASALQKSAPFFVILFSSLILKEKLTKEKAVAIVTAFIGILFVVKPRFSSDMLPSMLALLAAVFSGMAHTMIAFMRDKVHSHVIIFYFGLFSCCCAIPMVITNFVLPTPQQLLWLLGIGIFGGLGQNFLTAAYKLAPAGEVSIYNYTNIVLLTLVGFIFFKEVPDFWSVLGILLIIGSGVGVYRFNKE